MLDRDSGIQELDNKELQINGIRDHEEMKIELIKEKRKRDEYVKALC